MAVSLFNAWTWNRALPWPFDEPSISPRSKTATSWYNEGSSKIATLHAATLTAILQRMELELDPTSTAKGAVGTQNGSLYVVEYPSRAKELHIVVFNRTTGKFTAGRYEDLTQMPLPYKLKENEQSGSTLFFALLDIVLEDDEFKAQYEILLEQKMAGFPDPNAAAVPAYILCDNLYRRIKNASELGGAGISVVIPTTGNIQPFTTINLNKGTYSPDTVTQGVFQIMKPNGAKGSRRKKKIDLKDFIGKYQLRERKLSEKECRMVPELQSWYVIPKEIDHICNHALQTTKSNHPMRNFLLRGNAGTGKTEGAKAIAAGLHLPYMHLTCSANTEIFDILGQMMPVTEESKEAVLQYPTFEDIRMDASTAYFQLTGEYEEDISEDMVYQKLLEVIKRDAEEQSGKETKQKFRYVESPLIQAMRYGYLIEIQEPSTISNPGVLVGLNALLDGCGSITLPTGERVERHPDTVVVITTNVDYEGCRSLNQSILSRMDLIVDMEEPDQSTLVKRVLSITCCKEKDDVKKMAEIMASIQERCRMNMIDDGCCGVRELISWVQSYMICGDMLEAAKYTILPSVSADAENRADILSTCIEPILSF